MVFFFFLENYNDKIKSNPSTRKTAIGICVKAGQYGTLIFRLTKCTYTNESKIIEGPNKKTKKLNFN